jgi:hypothetical protein
MEGTLSAARTRDSKNRRAFTAALATVLACSSCSTDSTRWGRGEYHELKTYSGIEFRRGPMKIDPTTGELTIAWVGARAPEGSPRIVECHLFVFDDKPDPGEILQERSSHELCRKIIFGEIHVHLADATGTLLGEIEVETEGRHRAVSWILSPD